MAATYINQDVINLYESAGIKPPYRDSLIKSIKSGSSPALLKDDIKKGLRIVDEQDAVNRYVWYNLPCNITSQELERLLYYKGQLAFFYMKDLNEFYFMPYALDGTIDFYGRYNTVHPVPMTSGTDDKNGKAQAQYLAGIKLTCKYGMILPEEVTEDTLMNSTVLLHDYTKQLSQTIIPRVQVNEPLLNTIAECIPFARTAMLLGTGINAVRVQDADQADSIKDAAKGMINAAMKGEPWIPVIGNIEMQELAPGVLQKTSEAMLYMQSLDNTRLSWYGLENGGLFEKKAHLNDSENAVNQANVGLVMQDGLSIRQNFCNIVNSIWNLGIWCEVSESHTGADINGDGVAYDENMGESTGTEGGDAYEGE